MVVDLAVAEESEQPLDFYVADGAAEADAVDVRERDKHGGFVRNDPKMVEAAGRTEDRFLLDALHDSQAMIRVYDLVADFKCHSSPCLTKLRCCEANEVRKRAQYGRPMRLPAVL